MCYVVVKNKLKKGSYALKAKHGKALVKLKSNLESKAKENVQIILVSRPSAYGEYAPYNFADSEEELLSIVSEL